MKKLFLSIIFLGLFSSFSNLYARVGDWRPAYVIVNEGDTLFGQVDFRLPRDNQERALFRKDERSEVIVFSPNDILGYRFTPDGKFFVSREIEIGGVSRKTFVEFMAKGMMNLYHYVDENRRSHYLLESENDRNFLITRKRDGRFSLTNKHSGQTLYSGNFNEMIRLGFQDFYPIANHSENFRLNRQSMLNLAAAYHNLTCPQGGENIVFENVSRIQTQIMVYTAFEQYVFGFEVRDVKTRHLHPGVAIGVEMRLMRPQFSENFGSYIDLSLARPLNNEINLTRAVGLTTVDHYRKINFDVTMRAGVKYIHPTIGRFTPSAKLGFSLRCLVGESNSTNRVLVSPPGINIGLGTGYILRNRNSLSIDFQLDRYGIIERRRDLTGLRRGYNLTLSVYRLRLGYIF